LGRLKIRAHARGGPLTDFLVRAVPLEAFRRWLHATANAAADPITLQGRLLTGGSWSSATTRGRLLVVTVTASWCGPCRSGQGTLNHVANAYQAKGVRFLAVATYQGETWVLDSPEGVCAGQAWFEYPATFVLFSKTPGRVPSRSRGHRASPIPCCSTRPEPSPSGSR
jgi:thiol-disulfide isomerase/thioredoxin